LTASATGSADDELPSSRTLKNPSRVVFSVNQFVSFSKAGHIHIRSVGPSM
jgi:hypothetical protein